MKRVKGKETRKKGSPLQRDLNKALREVLGKLNKNTVPGRLQEVR